MEMALEANLASYRVDRVPPVFSPDCRTLIVAAGCDVLGLSTTTGEEVFKISGHSKPINCVRVASDKYLYTSSADGLINKCDYSDKIEVSETYRINGKITMFALSAKEDHLYLCTDKRRFGEDDVEDAENFDTLPYSVRLHNFKEEGSEAQKVAKLVKAPIMMQERDGFFVVATPYNILICDSVRNKILTDVRYSERSEYGQQAKISIKARLDIPLTAVSWHPTRRLLATGDAAGFIYLWSSLFENVSREEEEEEEEENENGENKSYKRAKTVYRGREMVRQRSEVKTWHAHAVNCLTFSSDGNYLFSGGEEATLVIWRVKGAAPMNFRSRMGSDLTTISCSSDGLLCAITNNLNNLTVINPVDLVTRWSRQCLTFYSYWKDMPKRVVLTPHPKSGEVAVNCYPGRLQMYDISLQRVNQEIEVVPYNRVSRIDEEDPSRPWVELCAFSPDGSYMATFEKRIGEEGVRRTALKFWDCDPSSRTATLNSFTEEPYESKIRAICFSPNSSLAVVSRKDGNMKLWSRQSSDDGSHFTWACRGTIQYKERAANGLSFSEDGSVLAVSYGDLVTVWDSANMRLVAVLDADFGKDDISSVHFLHGSTKLVALSSSRLVVWDVLTMDQLWAFKGQYFGGMAVWPSSRRDPGFIINGIEVDFAVLLTEDKLVSRGILLFNSGSPIPIYSYPVEGRVHGMALVCDGLKSGVVYLNKNGINLLSIPSLHSKEPQMIEAAPTPVRSSKKRQITGLPAFESKKARTDGFTAPANPRLLDDILDQSTLNLPSPHTIFEAFVSSLLPKPGANSIEIGGHSSAVVSSEKDKSTTGEGSNKAEGASQKGASANGMHSVGIRKSVLKLLLGGKTKSQKTSQKTS